MENFSDNKLINDYFLGDEKALEILIQRYLKTVYIFLFRYIGNAKEAEDISQKVFISVWRNLRKFDQSKSLKAWILGIAKNAAIDFFRKKKTIPFSAFEDESGENVLENTMKSEEFLPEEILENKNIKQELERVMGKIPQKYRATLMFYYKDGLNFREIADLLDVPMNTVKSWHRRGLMKLRELLVKQTRD